MPPTTTTTTAAAGSTVAVKNAESDLGPILVGVDGRTLYGFANDTPTQSNCEGTCTEAWPPVVVPANWTVAPGVDSGIFNTITRAGRHAAARRRQVPVVRLLGRHRTR